MKRLGLEKCTFSTLLSAMLMWVIAVHAGETIATGDALDVPARETPEALNSVLLGATLAGDRMVVIGERGHILYSDDKGETWSQADVPVRTTLTSVFFISPEKGWAVGHDTVILATQDGGITWSKLLDGKQANMLVSESAKERLSRLKQRLTQAEEDKKAAIKQSLEFAELALDEAQRDSEIGPSKTLMDIWFADENIGLAVGAAGYMLRTTDGGNSWQDWSASIGSIDFFHLYKLVGNKNGFLFLVGEYGQVYRSQDTGVTWELMEVPYQGSYFGGLSKESDGSVYLFGMSGVVLKSLDNGDSWEIVPSNTRSILQNAAVISGDRVAIVGLGGVLIAENDQKTAFIPIKLGIRAAYTAVLGDQNNKVIVVGETGISRFDTSVAGVDGSVKRINSLRFMFNKRDSE